MSVILTLQGLLHIVSDIRAAHLVVVIIICITISYIVVAVTETEV